MTLELCDLSVCDGVILVSCPILENDRDSLEMSLDTVSCQLGRMERSLENVSDSRFLSVRENGEILGECL